MNASFDLTMLVIFLLGMMGLGLIIVSIIRICINWKCLVGGSADERTKSTI